MSPGASPRRVWLPALVLAVTPAPVALRKSGPAVTLLRRSAAAPKLFVDVGYRDDLEALRARLAAAEAELAVARTELERARGVAVGVTPELLPRLPDPDLRSTPGGAPTSLTVINESARKIAVYWLSYEGRERRAGTVVPGGRIRTQTYVGHCWRIDDARTGSMLEHHHIAPGQDSIVYRG
jgi:hypothetical protein